MSGKRGIKKIYIKKKITEKGIEIIQKKIFKQHCISMYIKLQWLYIKCKSI